MNKENPRSTRKPRPVAKDIDGYLKKVPDEMRSSLERLRRAIATAAPGAVETIGPV